MNGTPEAVLNEIPVASMGSISWTWGWPKGGPFVDALLDTEPIRLSRGVPAWLSHAVSQGQPLATVELLRDLQERGGSGAAQRRLLDRRAKALDWSRFLPARLEAMIAERIARLDEHERHVLQIASVEGEAFTAEVVRA